MVKLVCAEHMLICDFHKLTAHYCFEILASKAERVGKNSEMYGVYISVGDSFYAAHKEKESTDLILDGIRYHISDKSNRVCTEREKKVITYWAGRMSLNYNCEAKFLKDAKEFVSMLENCVVVREAAATVNGVADLLLCYNGRFIACELKKKNGTPSPQQLNFIAHVKKAGGEAAVCKTLVDVWLMLRRTASIS
jgi:hypothetical protein